MTAGTIFQDSHLPLTTWFRAIRQVTSQKNGISALGLQRVLGLGSYKTAWATLHKLRRAMVQLSGQIGVTCKVFRRAGDTVHLIPINEQYAPQSFGDETIVWARRVLARIRPSQ